ncbi:MAG: DNA polymerase III subunit beta [Candidatus Marinimicrobia bacterium]|nr:DNA polymerase III subunit beta [Candidatus Neomarinimicrobiota bacterium]
MKFSIEREAIHKELQMANRVVPVRSTLPILTCVLLNVEDSKLRISSTDIEVTISSEVDVGNSENGSVAIQSKLLNDIIGVLPQGELTLSSDEKNFVTIECSSGSYSIAGKSPEDFPAVPVLEDGETIKINNEMMHRIIEKTAFAVSADMLRPALTGVLFEFKDDKLTTVATDGHRLAKLSINKSTGIKEDKRIIIPKKFLSLILSALSGSEENNFTVTENHVMITLGSTKFFTRIIDEKYPDYSSVIPTENDKEINVKVEGFLSSAVRVSIFANKTTQQIKLTISNNNIKISSADPESGGSGSEDIDCNYSGEDIEIGFNSEYLKDILRQIDTDDLIMTLKAPISAGLVYPAEQAENEVYTILLMPIRLTEEA